MNGKWMTYGDLAVALDISLEAAKRRVIRGKWPRMPGNDGRTRVQVPDELRPPRTADVRGPRTPDTRETESELVASLKSHIESLKADIERLTAERQVDRDELAVARAAADKATAELVELAKRLAAIAETQGEPEPPRRSMGRRALGWFLRN
jgi:hypothetical protein